MRTLNEAAIDQIVAACNGDLRGALKALLLVNEQLEAELAQLYAVSYRVGWPHAVTHNLNRPLINISNPRN